MKYTTTQLSEFKLSNKKNVILEEYNLQALTGNSHRKREYCYIVVLIPQQNISIAV